MRDYIRYAGIALLGSLLYSCSEEESSVAPALTGRLTDDAGNALGGKGIVVAYQLDYQPDVGDTLIWEVITTAGNRFLLENPQEDFLTFTIHDPASFAVEDTIYHGEMTAGQWYIEWDGRDYSGRVTTAGRKMARIQSALFGSSDFGFLFNPDYTVLDAPYQWMAETDEDGQFEIEELDLAFRYDHLFPLVDSDGNAAGAWRLDRQLYVYAVDENGLLAASGLIDLESSQNIVIVR